MSLRQFLLALHARWRVAAGIFAAVIVLVVIASLLAKNQYTASASVVVDAKPDPLSAAGTAGATYSGQMLAAYMATQVDIVASERVAERVVKDLRLDTDARFASQWQEADVSGEITPWIAAKLLKKLVVIPARESSVINISVSWTDPAMAAILTNAFAKAYVDTSVDLKVEPAKQYATWFDERSKDLRSEVGRRQKLLADFQRQNEMIVTDERLDIENARLAELSTQLVTIQSQRQDSQSRQRQSSRGNSDLAEVLQNPLIIGLKADLSHAEAQREDVLTRLGKNHPDYRTAAAEVDGLRNRINLESAKVAASLGNNAEINLSRESDIRAALEAQKARVLALRDQRDAASGLQNDVVTAQRNLDAVTQRLAQSSLESQTQLANIVVLTRALEPLRRSSPRFLFNLVVAVFLGTVLAASVVLILELLDRRLRSDEELVRLLGVPLLGTITSRSSDGSPLSFSTRLEAAAG